MTTRSSFQYGKRLAIVGSILTAMVMLPYVGLLLSAVGVFLLLKAMKTFSIYYQDNSIYQNFLTSAKYYAVVLTSLGVVLIIITTTSPLVVANRELSTICTAMSIAAFMLSILAAYNMRKTLNLFSQKTSAKTFAVAGNLLLAGSLAAVLPAGFLVVFVAWALAVACFINILPRNNVPLA
ncbi:MAG: DUF996 domain-containing protein [Candidatus Bathyarchaeia archaeon]